MQEIKPRVLSSCDICDKPIIIEDDAGICNDCKNKLQELIKQLESDAEEQFKEFCKDTKYVADKGLFINGYFRGIRTILKIQRGKL